VDDPASTNGSLPRSWLLVELSARVSRFPRTYLGEGTSRCSSSLRVHNANARRHIAAFRPVPFRKHGDLCESDGMVLAYDLLSRSINNASSMDTSAAVTWREPASLGPFTCVHASDTCGPVSLHARDRRGAIHNAPNSSAAMALEAHALDLNGSWSLVNWSWSFRRPRGLVERFQPYQGRPGKLSCLRPTPVGWVGPLSFKSGMESVGRLGLPLLHGHSIGC